MLGFWGFRVLAEIPHFPISPFPHFPISPFPHLPISPSPHLPISPIPPLPIAKGYGAGYSIGKMDILGVVRKS
ncbi:unknown protein [Microcystis aeruginosa NIES-843]|uniref:Uncharacterized protein n=1 Tax=Microcystis aeruginosa (strain NIES-843 / IAM M-2473) TaxID=449447 RepID=B0JTE8_MICAN|nr:unknown protein [Microcystis aeruginosa NIES-843]